MNQTFRDLPFMGVIRVNEEAHKVGYVMGDPAWANLGQGQPEVGDIPGAPARLSEISIHPDDHAYGPVEGLDELREAIAAHYNRLYRRGHASQYTAENVMVTPGGRAGLSRCGAALNNVRLGHFSPDYTAYEDLLRTFQQAHTHRIDLSPTDDFRIATSDLDGILKSRNLNTLLISNPCNPTGVVIRGEELASWVESSQRNSCALLMDEFYSHFIYAADDDGVTRPVSSAAYIEDVNDNRVVIFDGLTKSFRYPGWRVGWILAPRDMIKTMTAAGSFLDGGPSRPIQRGAIDVLEPGRADQETDAVRREFAIKQRLMIDKLEAMNIKVPYGPESTFYVYASIADLPEPIADGLRFMHAAFKHQVLTVPGAFFDVDPSAERDSSMRLHQFVRFSFGPPRMTVEAGLGRLAKMVVAHGSGEPLDAPTAEAG